MRLNLGCGGDHKEWYVNIDLYCRYADLVHDLTKPLPFEDRSIDEIFASHVIEHFSYEEWGRIKKDWYRVLRKGGKLEIFCPDIEHCMLNFLRDYQGRKWWKWIKTIYGSQERDGEFHKNGFTYEKLRADLETEGFRDFKEDHQDVTEISLVCIK